jgi:hypothetical protein
MWVVPLHNEIEFRSSRTNVNTGRDGRLSFVPTGPFFGWEVEVPAGIPVKKSTS